MEFNDIILGSSKHAGELRKRLSRLAAKRVGFVLVGETGTGKTRIATAIVTSDHSCKILELAYLNESELKSRLDSTTSCTLVIEGLDASSFSVQSIIAKAMSRPETNIRYIVTLREKVSELAGRKRLVDEIYAKLLEFESVEILPLRKRPEDIPHLLRQMAPDLVIDINSLDMLVKRSWRENFRELELVVERSLALSENGVFMLPAEYIEERTEIVQVVNNILSGSGQALDESLDVMEKGVLERALQRFGFNTTKVAQFLGISESALEDKLHRLALVSTRGERG